MTSLPTMPLMHGAAQWSVMSGSFTGNRIVLLDKFENEWHGDVKRIYSEFSF